MKSIKNIIEEKEKLISVKFIIFRATYVVMTDD